MRQGANVFLAFLVGIATGALVGAVNGFLYSKLKMPSFISTLAMSGIIYGIALLPTESSPVPIANDLFNEIFGSGDIGPIPILMIWMIAAVILGHIMPVSYTHLGGSIAAPSGIDLFQYIPADSSISLLNE